MSYKYSKGSTVQGDIKAADDTERNTVIDFGEDQIEFQTRSTKSLMPNWLLDQATDVDLADLYEFLSK